MADKTFTTVLPPLKAVDLLDGTHALAVKIVSGIGGLDASAWVVANNAPAAIKTAAGILQGAGYPVWVCDGIADEVEIKSAMAAAGATGGTVHLSNGTFYVASGCEGASGITLEGSGYGTIITPSGPIADPLTGIINFRLYSNSIIRNLRVAGSAVNRWGNYGICCDTAHDMLVEDCWVTGLWVDDSTTFSDGAYNITVRRCYLTGQTTITSNTLMDVDTGCYNILVDNCIFDAVGAAGISIHTHPAAPQAHDITIQNCVFKGVYEKCCIHVGGTGGLLPAYNIKILNNQISPASTVVGSIFLGEVTDLLVAGNTIYHINDGEYALISSNSGSWNRVVFRDNTWKADSMHWAGIYFDPICTYSDVLFSGDKFIRCRWDWPLTGTVLTRLTFSECLFDTANKSLVRLTDCVATFIGCTFKDGNDASAAVGVDSCGLLLAGSLTDVVVDNSRFIDTRIPKKQQYGIYVATGTGPWYLRGNRHKNLTGSVYSQAEARQLNRDFGVFDDFTHWDQTPITGTGSTARAIRRGGANTGGIGSAGIFVLFREQVPTFFNTPFRFSWKIGVAGDWAATTLGYLKLAVSAIVGPLTGAGIGFKLVGRADGNADLSGVVYKDVAGGEIATALGILLWHGKDYIITMEFFPGWGAIWRMGGHELGRDTVNVPASTTGGFSLINGIADPAADAATLEVNAIQYEKGWLTPPEG